VSLSHGGFLKNVELDPGHLHDCSEIRGRAISPILESRVALTFNRRMASALSEPMATAKEKTALESIEQAAT
jgi:hypothetical protein